MEHEKIGADSSVISPGTAPYTGSLKLTPAFSLLENSVNTWWVNLKKFIILYYLGLVSAVIPIVVLLVLLALSFVPSLQTNIGYKVANLIIITFSILYIAYAMIRSYVGMFLLVKNNYLGQEKEIFKETEKWVLPYIWLTILTSVLILFWTLLLIIPGIIFSILYSLVVYVLFFEDKKGMAAVKRSVQLVKNYWWAVLGRLFLMGLALWIVTMIISVPSLFTSEGTVIFYIWNLVVQILSMLIGPIVIIFTCQIYQDLVKIKK